jgi:hypothetical protein
MTTNRLAVVPAVGRPGKVTLESLHDYADKLNAMHWVRQSGKPYFVNQREKPGTKTGEIEHFLDRNG